MALLGRHFITLLQYVLSDLELFDDCSERLKTSCTSELQQQEDCERICNDFDSVAGSRRWDVYFGHWRLEGKEGGSLFRQPINLALLSLSDLAESLIIFRIVLTLLPNTLTSGRTRARGIVHCSFKKGKHTLASGGCLRLPAIPAKLCQNLDANQPISLKCE